MAAEARHESSQLVRALRRDLVGAAEAKIVQVVAMVDALPVRGDADALIAPLRPRLAQMRLSRPASLGRLLFLPVQPALIDGREWRRGSPAVPRTACQPLITMIRSGLGETAARVERRLSGQIMSNTPLLRTEGRSLWPQAATILRDAAAPTKWAAQSGLAESDFAVVARTVQLVLSQAIWVQEAAAGLPTRPEDVADTGPCLADIIRDGSGPAEVIASGLFVVLLGVLGDADARIDAIENATEATARPVIRRARAQAMAFALDRLDLGASLVGSLEQAAGSVRRDAHLLDVLAEQARTDAGRRSRVQEARRNLDEQCRARFQAALEADLVLPTPAGGDAAPVDDAAVTSLEQAARALHRFEQSARRIGGRDFYDQALKSLAAQLGRPDATALSAVDRVRLTELLLGADSAMELLKQLDPAE